MRSLALKLAVVGSGAAIAASTSVASAASVAHAGSAAGGAILATGGGAASAVKVAAMSVALLGAAATGVVMVKRGVDETRDAPAAAHIRQIPSERALEPQVTQPVVTHNDPARQVERIAEPAPVALDRSDVDDAPRRHRHAHEAARTPATRESDGLGSTNESSTRRHRSKLDVAPQAAEASESAHELRAQRRIERREARTGRAARESGGGMPTVTAASADEIELLRGARAALTSRPKLAYKLTEEHRAAFPDGVFTQERDALAVEALMRAGEMKDARARAEDFVRRYPSSPHAHRFRETMNIQ